MNKTLEPKTASSINSPSFIDKTSTSQNQGNQGQSITSLTAFSGPIPPPMFLEQYEKLVSGSAKRFLDEPHCEAEHRRTLEKLMVTEQIKLSKRGQWMAFSLASICIGAAFTAIFFGYDLAGLGALFISVGSFVGVFVYSKVSSRES